MLRNWRTAVIVSALLPALLAGCAETFRFKIGIPPDRFDRRCVPASTHLREVSLKDLPAEKQRAATQPEAPAATKFSPRAVQIAEIIDALPLLKQLYALQTEHAADRTVEVENGLLKARQQLLGRIMLAMLEVSSVTAETICERNRADWIADRLQDAYTQRIKYQTLLAVIIGAFTNIASGGLALAGEESAAAATGIAGGALGGFFGITPLFYQSQHPFQDRRNLLREVWEGPKESRLFPRSVWRYLNRRKPDDALGQSVRDELRAEWRTRLVDMNGDEGHQRLALIFKEEGRIYRIADLRARSEMLETLAVTINLMHEDLEQLIREVVVQEAILD